MDAEVIYTPQLSVGRSRIGPEGDWGKHKTGQEQSRWDWAETSSDWGLATS